MKKLLSTAIILGFVFVAQAQDPFDPLRDRQLYFDSLNILGILTAMYLISSFILQIFRQHYSFRIKNRMLDKGTEENVVRQMLQPDKKENKNYVLQWFFTLGAIGVGLILVTLVRPYGVRSVAILALSVAAGFGAYYYFTRQNEKINETGTGR
ncbi:MAG TPA: hypothetical protein VGM24_05635 [Puia sp.]|jgi:O-antigen/teichoic acid export membrane protein